MHKNVLQVGIKHVWIVGNAAQSNSVIAWCRTLLRRLWAAWTCRHVGMHPTPFFSASLPYMCMPLYVYRGCELTG